MQVGFQRRRSSGLRACARCRDPLCERPPPLARRDRGRRHDIIISMVSISIGIGISISIGINININQHQHKHKHCEAPAPEPAPAGNAWQQLGKRRARQGEGRILRRGDQGLPWTPWPGCPLR